MVGMYGIGEVPGPANSVPVQGAGRRPEPKPASNPNDSVSFSHDAEGMSVVLFARQNAANEEFRQERIEEARQNLARGLHKVQGLIEIVASRITKYVQTES